MKKNKSSISKGTSYKEIGEFWDSHDLRDYWGKTRRASIEVDLQSERTYYPLDGVLSEKLRAIALKRGISPETLLNLWVQEKISFRSTSK